MFLPYNAPMNSWRLSTNTYKKTASTVYTAGNLVSFPSSLTGYIVEATSTTQRLIGIGCRTTASTNADYALNSFHPVLVPKSFFDCKMIADTTSAVAATDTGLLCDLSNASTVNRGATSTKVVQIQQVLSSTKVVVTFNPAAIANA